MIHHHEPGDIVWTKGLDGTIRSWGVDSEGELIRLPPEVAARIEGLVGEAPPTEEQ